MLNQLQTDESSCFSDSMPAVSKDVEVLEILLETQLVSATDRRLRSFDESCLQDKYLQDKGYKAASSNLL